MKAGAGVSGASDTRSAAVEASLAAASQLGGAPAELAVVFASPDHRVSASKILEGVHEAVRPSALIGCVAEAVVAGNREIERGPAVSVWLASLPQPVETFHMEFVATPSGGAFAGWRFEGDRDAAASDARERVADGGRRAPYILLCDPFSFPVDHLLKHLNASAPGTLIAGGMASGAARRGETVLLLDRSVHHEGAVGVRIPSAVELLGLVSQGCRPIGQSYVVTRAERNLLLELAGRPPLDRLREILASLAPADRDLVSNGLHLGRVIDEYKPEHGQGDFLIRSVLGVDPESGALAVGDEVEVGETVQFHVRDAATADEELRSLLERVVPELPGIPAGALLFTCNGRGTRMFPTPHHDAALVDSFIGGAPVAGLFCAGELGPVGGKNFLHGFTASVALFVDTRESRGEGGGADRGS